MAYPPPYHGEIPDVEAQALNAPLPPFTEAEAFRGYYPGFTFKQGDDGLGYYSDTPATTPLTTRLATPLAPVGPTPVAFGIGMNKLSEQDQRNGMPDFESSKRVMSAKFPEPSPRVLGIHLASHGRRFIGAPPIFPFPGVSISKFNVSGFCGFGIVSPKSVAPMTDKHIARSLLYGWELAPSKEKYLQLTVTPLKGVPNCIDVEGSCSIITDPPNGWLPKVYTTDGEVERGIWVAYKDKIINLFTCSPLELVSCLRQQDEPFVAQDSRLTTDILRYVLDNNAHKRSQIDTQQVFNLIEFFRAFAGVDTVRIYDSTCNSESSDTSTLPPDTGFGGKRTKRRKSKRRKSRKHYK